MKTPKSQLNVPIIHFWEVQRGHLEQEIHLFRTVDRKQQGIYLPSANLSLIA